MDHRNPLGGNTDEIILFSLRQGDKYASELEEELMRFFDEDFPINRPFLLDRLKRLENDGWILSYFAGQGRKRKEYRYSLTDDGRKRLDGFLCEVNPSVMWDRVGQLPLSVKTQSNAGRKIYNPLLNPQRFSVDTGAKNCSVLEGRAYDEKPACDKKEDVCNDFADAVYDVYEDESVCVSDKNVNASVEQFNDVSEDDFPDFSGLDIDDELQLFDDATDVSGFSVIDEIEVTDCTETVDYEEVIHDEAVSDTETVDCTDIIGNAEAVDCIETSDDIRAGDCTEITDGIEAVCYTEITDDVKSVDCIEMIDDTETVDCTETACDREEFNREEIADNLKTVGDMEAVEATEQPYREEFADDIQPVGSEEQYKNEQLSDGISDYKEHDTVILPENEHLWEEILPVSSPNEDTEERENSFDGLSTEALPQEDELATEITGFPDKADIILQETDALDEKPAPWMRGYCESNIELSQKYEDDESSGSRDEYGNYTDVQPEAYSMTAAESRAEKPDGYLRVRPPKSNLQSKNENGGDDITAENNKKDGVDFLSGQSDTDNTIKGYDNRKMSFDKNIKAGVASSDNREAVTSPSQPVAASGAPDDYASTVKNFYGAEMEDEVKQRSAFVSKFGWGAASSMQVKQNNTAAKPVVSADNKHTAVRHGFDRSVKYEKPHVTQSVPLFNTQDINGLAGESKTHNKPFTPIVSSEGNTGNDRKIADFMGNDSTYGQSAGYDYNAGSAYDTMLDNRPPIIVASSKGYSDDKDKKSGAAAAQNVEIPPFTEDEQRRIQMKFSSGKPREKKKPQKPVDKTKKNQCYMDYDEDALFPVGAYASGNETRASEERLYPRDNAHEEVVMTSPEDDRAMAKQALYGGEDPSARSKKSSEIDPYEIIRGKPVQVQKKSRYDETQGLNLPSKDAMQKMSVPSREQAAQELMLTDKKALNKPREIKVEKLTPPESGQAAIPSFIYKGTEAARNEKAAKMNLGITREELLSYARGEGVNVPNGRSKSKKKYGYVSFEKQEEDKDAATLLFGENRRAVQDAKNQQKEQAERPVQRNIQSQSIPVQTTAQHQAMFVQPQGVREVQQQGQPQQTYQSVPQMNVSVSQQHSVMDKEVQSVAPVKQSDVKPVQNVSVTHKLDERKEPVTHSEEKKGVGEKKKSSRKSSDFSVAQKKVESKADKNNGETYKKTLHGIMGDQLGTANLQQESDTAPKNKDTFRRDYEELVNLDIDGLSEKFTEEEGIAVRKKTNAAREFESKKILYANKLNMVSAVGATFFVFAELLVMFIIAAASIENFNGLSLLICGLVFALLPTFFAIKLWKTPNKKSMPAENPSSELVVSIIVTVILALIVLVLNVLVMVTDFSNGQQLVSNFIAPIAMIMGVPVWSLIKLWLYRSFVV